MLVNPARRVLFIAFDFPPSIAVGAYSCAQIARNLPPAGWEPIILTADDRYYDYVDRRVQPTVQVVRTATIPHPFEVYRRLKSLLTGKSITVSMVTHGVESRDLRTRLKDSVLALLRIPDMYLGWIPPAVFGGARAVSRFEINHLMSSGPCWTNHLVGMILATLTRLPWTAHFRDPWLDSRLDDFYSTRIGHVINAALEKAVVTRAQTVVCVTERHTELFRTRYSQLPPGKFVTIPNGFDEAEWTGVEARNRNRTEDRQFVVTYTGTLYLNRNPEPVFRAARNLLDQDGLDPASLRIDLVGWCETAQGENIKTLAGRWGLERCVHIVGPLTKVETLQRITNSDLLLLLGQDWTLQVPAKAYEYLRAGRPVLALAPPEGAIADLFKRTGGAWVLSHKDDAGILAALREAYLSWSNGTAERVPNPNVVAEFDRARLAKRLVAVFEAPAKAILRTHVERSLDE